TNHSPVSPKNVVVAGRVSSSVAADEDCVRDAGAFGPAAVPVEPLCAVALAVSASPYAQATATRLSIVCRLQSRRSSAGALHSFPVVLCEALVGNRRGVAGRLIGVRRHDQTTATAAAYLATLAAGRSRFVRSPLVGR